MTMPCQIEERNRKQKIVDQFLARNSPHTGQTPLKFDLRGYAAYIQEHNLRPEDITPELLEKFSAADKS